MQDFLNQDSLAVKCAIVRGGTSKGIYIMENELPENPTLREKVILGIFGSPDLREIDGLGGADLLTSKCAIIGPPSVPGADVDYTFAQVSIDTPHVEFNSNCGNISAGVGPFAIHFGLVRATEPVTNVRVHLKNIGKIMNVEVPVKNGKPAVDGDFEIDGVPGTGARIGLDWSDVVGGMTGSLLPTGNPVDIVEHEGKQYRISIVDAGTLSFFVPAEDFGLTCTESPMAMQADEKLVELIEAVRGKGCQLAGLVDDWRKAKEWNHFMPFFNIVAKPVDYTCINGKQMKKEDADVLCRLSSMGLIHKAYAGSGSVCFAAAARIKGSVVYDLLSEEAHNRSLLYIGHASGRMPAESVAEEVDGKLVLKKLNFFRTARVIMEGTVYVRKSTLG